MRCYTTCVMCVSLIPHVLLQHDDRPMGARVAAMAQFLLSRGYQAFCGLRGHHMLLHFEPDRLSLRCLTCGAQTPGWRLDPSPHLRRGRPRIVVRATVRSDDAVSRQPRHRPGPTPASLPPKAA